MPPSTPASTTPLSALLGDLSIQDKDGPIGDSNNEDYESDSDPENVAIHTLYDLISLESANLNKPIFTRAMINRMVKEVALVLSEQQKPPSEREITTLSRPYGDHQVVNIWQASRNICKTYAVIYLTRIEMCPGFQKDFGEVYERSKALRSMNMHMPVQQRQFLRTPYFIETWLPSTKEAPTNHLSNTWMEHMRTRLGRTQRFWEDSDSCTQLLERISTGARKLQSPITKIVCVGLGKLNPAAAWYGSAVQHLAVFSMAEALDAINQELFPTTSSVQIIAQDPSYEPADHTLLPEFTSSQIVFTNTEPENLLAIDKNTLVVTAFLPVNVPLVQIIADMFADGEETGPGMIICDRDDTLSVDKRLYCLRMDRYSPSVAKFLLQNYQQQEKFDDWDQECREDAIGDSTTLRYWLPSMNLWVRSDEEGEE
jgi:hypothetical protein